MVTDTPKKILLQKRIDCILNEFHEQILSKKDLEKALGATHVEVTEIIHILVKMGAAKEKRKPDERGWSVAAWTIFKPFVQIQSSFRNLNVLKTPIGSKSRRYGRLNECTRCGMSIGHGRHAKSSKGHIKDICDLEMTRMLMET